MILHESHCHSAYSNDVKKDYGSTIDEICSRAVELGLGSVAVTDHLEIDQLMGNTVPPLDNESVRRDIYAAKEKYKGILDVVYGVELAQYCHHKERGNKILDKFKYDFIIGSVHCVRGFPDYSDMDYSHMTDAMVWKTWELYLEEMTELVDWGGFDTLAHITYPYRYFHRHGRENVIKVFENGREMFEPILKKIIQKGIALEVNTSGLRQGDGTTFPHTDLVKFYRELGGELVTVGSDAHCAADLAKNIGDIYELLKEIGFSDVVTFLERKPVFHKL